MLRYRICKHVSCNQKWICSVKISKRSVRLITPEEAITIPAIIAPPKSAKPLRNWALPIILLIIVNATRNTVHPIRKNPFRLEINAIPVLSNDTVTKKNTDIKITEAHMMNLCYLFSEMVMLEKKVLLVI